MYLLYLNWLFSPHFLIKTFFYNSYGSIKTGWLGVESLIIPSLFTFCSTPMLNFPFHFTSSFISFPNALIFPACLLTIFPLCTLSLAFFRSHSYTLTKWPSCQGDRYLFILSHLILAIASHTRLPFCQKSAKIFPSSKLSQYSQCSQGCHTVLRSGGEYGGWKMT